MWNHPDSICVHGSETPAYSDGIRSLSFPIYQTASFAHDLVGHNQFNYTRQDNPTRLRLEETVAALEDGADAIAFSSGMAAIAAVFELFSPGDHIVCSEDLYGGVTRLLRNVSSKNGLLIDFVDATEPNRISEAIRSNTKAIYLETPSNPMMQIIDLRAASAIARSCGALLIVDNTFMSPVFQKPFHLGADIVVHSGTKYLSGHNDTISGFVVTSTKEMGEKIHLISKTTGGALAPFDSWLVLRGLKTLCLRMQRSQENAIALSQSLQHMPHVTRVYYPGLEDHPGHEIQKSQATGFGSMLSFRVDSRERAVHVLQHVSMIIFAESLGGTESLITYPLTQTHADVPDDTRRRLGIDETLLRLSVGIENIADLEADLRQVLEEKL
ncbi:MAG: PLP-dependent transferase [Clostridia bacterium]|nr:PLP-dependent transferase [Clostridia bacterium]